MNEDYDGVTKLYLFKDNNTDTHTLAWVDDPVLKTPVKKDHPGDMSID